MKRRDLLRSDRAVSPQTSRRATLGSYRVEQRQISHHGRVFQFVSYDGHRGDVAQGQDALQAMWFVMCEGTRWEVGPQLMGERPEETDRRLLDWLERHVP